MVVPAPAPAPAPALAPAPTSTPPPPAPRTGTGTNAWTIRVRRAEASAPVACPVRHATARATTTATRAMWVVGNLSSHCFSMRSHVLNTSTDLTDCHASNTGSHCLQQHVQGRSRHASFHRGEDTQKVDTRGAGRRARISPSLTAEQPRREKGEGSGSHCRQADKARGGPLNRPGASRPPSIPLTSVYGPTRY